MKVSSFAKAIVAALAAGVAAAVPLLSDGVFNLADVLVVAGAVAGTFGITFAVPNKA